MHGQKRILIADNDDNDVKFLDIMFSHLGFEVEKAEDGNSALKKIKQKTIDLAILNTILPKKSCWEILKALKADGPKNPFFYTQIILLSDIEDAKEEVEAYELGAEFYIAKPLNFPLVFAKIRQSLKNKELYIELGRSGA